MNTWRKHFQISHLFYQKILIKDPLLEHGSILSTSQLSQLFIDYFRAQPEETEKRAKALAEFNTALGKLSEKHKGPFFFGDKISLVDIFIAPWAVRDFILRDYREFKRSMVQGWADWAQRLEDYPSVVKTTSVRNSSSYQVIATDCRTGTAVLY